MESLKCVVPKVDGKELIVADVSTGDEAMYLTLGLDWERVGEEHVLWLEREMAATLPEAGMSGCSEQRDDRRECDAKISKQRQRSKVIQYVFWDELRFKIEDECSDKVTSINLDDKEES
ncbi:hypothetical protein Slin15195_G121570 [Septoria linicola]|uniref:Uncharacterized protein n=1 Tax=Septoria linicola TaxID=215465 RepID=A0A9Q9B4K5_9PEZI|nr:hypothetical protein Slin15195_G121570 [Septoria linicola]